MKVKIFFLFLGTASLHYVFASRPHNSNYPVNFNRQTTPYLIEKFGFAAGCTL
jgi:hypothetical protein